MSLFNSPQTSSLRPTPWKLDFAFAIFILYLLAAPLLARGLVYPFARYFPQFEKATIQNAADDQPEENPISNEPTLSYEDSENAPGSSDERQVPTSSTETDVDDDDVFSSKNVATQHPMARLLIRSYHTPHFSLVVILFFVTVVVLAPVTEELIFRVTLQGASERAFNARELLPDPNAQQLFSDQTLSDEQRLEIAPTLARARRLRTLRIAAAIMTPAILFALLHAGVPDDAENPQPLADLFNAIVCSGVGNLLTILVATPLLIHYGGASQSDLGLGENFHFNLKTLRETACLWLKGVLIMLLSAPFIFGLNAFAKHVFPDAIIAPIPILLLAIIEGIVYFRTRRVAITVGIHMTLNFISFAILVSSVLAR